MDCGQRDFDKKGMKGVFVSLRDGHKSNSRWTLDKIASLKATKVSNHDSLALLTPNQFRY